MASPKSIRSSVKLREPEVYFITPGERFIAGILSRYDCDSAIVLISIEHDDIDPAILINNSGESIYHDSNWYQHFPFDIELPDDVQDEPIARLKIANADRRIGIALDSISTPPKIGIKVVSSVDPEHVVMSWLFFELRNVSRNAFEVTGDVIIRQYSTEPFPNIRVRKGNFQNLFKA